MGTTSRSQPENFGRRIPTFGRGSTTGVVGGEGNRFPSLEISIDLSLFSFTSFVHRSLSPHHGYRGTAGAPLVPSLRACSLSVELRFMDVEALSLSGVAPLLRFTFAMSLPVRSGRGKSVTQQQRSEAIGSYMREARKTGPAILLPSVASRVSPRSRRENIYWMLSHTSGHVLVTVLHRSPYEIGSLLKWILCGRVVAAILDPPATR